MTFNFKLKTVLLFISFALAQNALAQSAPSDAALQPIPVTDSEAKPPKSARVVIEWATIFDSVGMSKTEISVDQTVVCKINKDAKICDLNIEPGKREIALNTNLDFGTYSERYDLEAGKRYKLEVVMNKKNLLMDTLFFGMPVSAMFNQKGKTASLKFELVNVSEEPQK